MSQEIEGKGSLAATSIYMIEFMQAHAASIRALTYLVTKSACCPFHAGSARASNQEHQIAVWHAWGTEHSYSLQATPLLCRWSSCCNSQLLTSRCAPARAARNCRTADSQAMPLHVGHQAMLMPSCSGAPVRGPMALPISACGQNMLHRKGGQCACLAVRCGTTRWSRAPQAALHRAWLQLCKIVCLRPGACMACAMAAV